MLESVANRLFNKMRITQHMKNFGYLTSSNITTLVFTFLLSYALTRLFTPTDYGIYKYILALIGIAELVSAPGFKDALFFSYAKNQNKQVPWEILLQKIKYNLLGIGIIFIGFLFIFNMHLSFFQILNMLAISALFLISNTTTLVYVLYYIYNQFNNLSKIIVYRNVFQFIATILVVIITQNVFFSIIAFLLSKIVIEGIFIRKKIHSSGTIPKNLKKETIKWSVQRALGGISGSIDSIVVMSVLGPSDLAVYKVSQMIPDAVRNLFKNVITVFVPTFIKLDKNQIKKKTLKLFGVLTIIGIFLVMLYGIFAILFFKFLFPAYSESVKYTLIYSPILITVNTFSFSTYIRSRKLRKKMSEGILLQTSAYVILLITLVPAFGIVGAILASLTSKVLNMIFQLLITITD